MSKQLHKYQSLVPMDDRSVRIAKQLVKIAKTIAPTESPTRLLTLMRGLALRAQLMRLAPAAFDSENGQDALEALAHANTYAQLVQLAESNTHILSVRWAKVVYVAGLELPSRGTPSSDERRRAADIERDPPSSQWTGVKLFDKWTTERK